MLFFLQSSWSTYFVPIFVSRTKKYMGMHFCCIWQAFLAFFIWLYSLFGLNHCQTHVCKFRRKRKLRALRFSLADLSTRDARSWYFSVPRWVSFLGIFVYAHCALWYSVHNDPRRYLCVAYIRRSGIYRVRIITINILGCKQTYTYMD